MLLLQHHQQLHTQQRAKNKEDRQVTETVWEGRANLQGPNWDGEKLQSSFNGGICTVADN